MKTPKITVITAAPVLSSANKLPKEGVVKQLSNRFAFLDINNEYIHTLWPLLSSSGFKKPDYFKKGSVGAHITLVYPDENKTLKPEYLNQKHFFSIDQLAIAELGEKSYLVLLIKSDSLITLRKNHGLPPLLNFNGYEIGLHITIGNK